LEGVEVKKSVRKEKATPQHKEEKTEATRNRRHYLKCKISTEARYIEIKHPCMLLDFLIPTKDKSCLLNHENLQVSLSALESKLYAIGGLNLAFSFPRL
jgi:hypothetical protein